MSATQQAQEFAPELGMRRPFPRIGFRGSDAAWAIAFIVPYAAVFLAFVAEPIIYGLWMGARPALYGELFQDPTYLRTVVNTLLFTGLSVNIKMFLALLLSGFFMDRNWWIRSLLVIYMLPWALPALCAFLAVHWMLIGSWGFLDRLLLVVFHIEGPIWFNSYWLALWANILAYIWKWMPFWTLIFLAARMAIPEEIHEAAEVDGASGISRFIYVTFPLLANLYLICTLLSTVWTIGDFNTVYFVSGGAPALSTEVLATLGVRDAFTVGAPDLGVAVMMSALPVMIPIVILLMRKVRTSEVQL